MEHTEEFDSFDQHAVIKVCGIGGGGGNAVNRMIEEGLSDVQFIAINTDAQDLKKSLAPLRLQIGKQSSAGLGAGAKPEVGRAACEEDRDRVRALLTGADMVFLTLGLGGGTGTGAAPIVAKEASASGALTVAIVTLPFSFEGEERMGNAIEGLAALEQYVDTLVVVPNDRIAQLSQYDTSLLDAFKHGDEVLHNGVRAISELITIPGLINLDFADIRTVMQSRGRALMGIGIAEGEDRAVRAAEEAVVCPLLEQSNINGAKGVIVNVRGGSDVRMKEVQEASEFIRKNASPEANIILGAVIDKEARSEFQVTVIAAGFPRADLSVYKKKAIEVCSPKTVEPFDDAKGPRAEAKRTERPLAATAHTPAAKAPSSSPKKENVASKEPSLFDFTSDDAASATIQTGINSDDDINIPAFIRARRKQQNSEKK